MTIRASVNRNATIIHKTKIRADVPGRSQSIEHVRVSGAAAEKRDIDAREANQTTTPSNAHNGPVAGTTPPP